MQRYDLLPAMPVIGFQHVRFHQTGCGHLVVLVFQEQPELILLFPAHIHGYRVGFSIQIHGVVHDFDSKILGSLWTQLQS